MNPHNSKPLPEIDPADQARFWSHVEVGQPNECWPWKASKFAGGYGQLKIKYRTVKAHRVAFRLFHGYDPEGALIRHTCDNPPCCNGLHLVEGTCAENTADCVTRGRNNPAIGNRHGSKTHPESRARGERVGGSKLTTEQVSEMRSLYLAGGCTQQDIATRFGIERGTVGTILRGNHWAHVPVDSDAARVMGQKNRVRIGESNACAKLTETDVRAIRVRYAAGGVTMSQIATEYGVNRESIFNVLHRRTWSHVN